MRINEEIKTIAKRYALTEIKVQANKQNNQDTTIKPNPPVEKNNEMLLPSTTILPLMTCMSNDTPLRVT